MSLCFSGPVRVFEAVDSDPQLVKTIDAHSPVGRKIQLKVGAQVGMCIQPEFGLLLLFSFCFVFVFR